MVLGTTALGVATSAATIIGSVTDFSENVIQEASVAATNSDTNIGKEATHATQRVHEKG